MSSMKRFYLPVVAGLVGFDQLTKILAYVLLKGRSGVFLIPHVLQLQYLENRGAAFGMLKNKQWLFVVFALLVGALTVYFYARLPQSKKYQPLRVLCCVLAAGAVGNMIDRVIHTYVIDFIYFSIIDFPIFNIADIYVVVGCAAFLYLILFRYKDEDFEDLKKKKSRH